MSNLNSLFPIFLWLIIIFLIAFISKKIFPKKKELIRKIVHIGTGPIIPLAWWLNLSKESAIGLASIITILLVVNHRSRLLPAIEDVPRKSFGTIAYGLSITILIMLFWPEHASAVTAGVLVMAFGDGLAGLIGKEIKSQNWKIFGQQKSVAGTLTMGLIGAIVLFSINAITGQQLGVIHVFTISSLAVILEQISFWGIDNLTVPIGVALGWIWIGTI